uniref:non-specific serine/threonine protein kinase n=1 Tax=Acidobacterium capsulatum TaxID=33075 RepID=A0A7V4XQM1_9BACT
MMLPAEVEVGAQLDHYRIDAKVAETAMATIYRATDERDGRQVAIKVPHASIEADPVLFDRFKREEEIGESMHHPNVMQIVPHHDHSRPYMVMEWVPGKLLRTLLHEEHAFSQERAIRITLGILRALEYIHNHGVVHRDLKPENIMVDEHDHIKLIDFGIASLEGAKRLTYTGYTQALGTPEYISPEQVKGKRGDARSDLYALGIMLYEMLTGKTPFTGPSPLAVMNERLMRHPLPPREANPQITPHLQEVLYRALERDPRNRYPNAHAFALDLENLDKVGVADRSELREWKTQRSGSLRKVLVYVALAAIPIALFVAMLLLSQRH